MLSVYIIPYNNQLIKSLSLYNKYCNDYCKNDIDFIGMEIKNYSSIENKFEPDCCYIIDAFYLESLFDKLSLKKFFKSQDEFKIIVISYRKFFEGDKMDWLYWADERTRNQTFCYVGSQISNFCDNIFRFINGLI